MSSFLNKGKRLQKAKDKKEVKKRVKAMYVIMDELDTVASAIYKEHPDVNEDTLKDIVGDFTELKMGEFEQFILLGKLTQLKEYYEKNKS